MTEIPMRTPNLTPARVLVVTPFLAVYPPEHELAGHVMERGRKCRCGAWFPQHVLNAAWLESASPGQRNGYKELCEKMKNGLFAFPKQCGKCARETIRSAAHPPQTASQHARQSA